MSIPFFLHIKHELKNDGCQFYNQFSFGGEPKPKYKQLHCKSLTTSIQVALSCMNSDLNFNIICYAFSVLHYARTNLWRMSQLQHIFLQGNKNQNINRTTLQTIPNSELDSTVKMSMPFFKKLGKNWSMTDVSFTTNFPLAGNQNQNISNFIANHFQHQFR